MVIVYFAGIYSFSKGSVFNVYYTHRCLDEDVKVWIKVIKIDASMKRLVIAVAGVLFLGCLFTYILM